MYKRWTMNFDEKTNNNPTLTKQRFFSTLEGILTELGIEFTSRYTYPNNSSQSYRDCLCEESNLSKIKEKGYPEWICGFKDFPYLINSVSATFDSSGYSEYAPKNYADGFLSFKIGDVEYCFVYATTYLDIANGTFSHVTLLANNGMKKYKYVIHKRDDYNDRYESATTCLLQPRSSGTIMIEYIKTDYMEFLNFIRDGSVADNYYSNSCFLSLGYYTITDGIYLSFPNGMLFGENLTTEMTTNNLTFATDAEGILRLTNTISGDLSTSNYKKGNIYYGIANNTILGMLPNSITINNNNYPPGTIFNLNGTKYYKIYMPTIFNINCTPKNYALYGSALSMAFHKGVYE